MVVILLQKSQFTRVDDIIVCFDDLQNVLPARVLQLSAQHHLVQQEVGAVEIEDQIELTYVAKVLIQRLDEKMDRIQGEQFIVVVRDAGHKVQRRVATVHDLRFGG